MEKDLGGREPPLERGGSLPPNLPLSPRTSPMSPPFTKRRFVSLFEGGGDMGEVFCVWGGVNLLQRAASRPFCGWGSAVRRYALHECRDSACRRPFGVRRNAAGVCSEMTQWVRRVADILHSLECYLINATMSVMPQCLIILQYLILLQCLISLQCLINTIMLL